MYAIIQAGGRQLVVSPGETVQIEKLPGEAGEAVEFDNVVAYSNDDGEMKLGEDAKAVRVSGVIEEHARGKKVRVFKFKRRKMYRLHKGHRRDYTNVKIEAITA